MTLTCDLDLDTITRQEISDFLKVYSSLVSLWTDKHILQLYYHVYNYETLTYKYIIEL